MHSSEPKHRVIFIDLMRAIAVLQMVQGHTVDVLLSPEFRTAEFPIYNIWYFLRGMTAPIFMFTAGTTFTYLFKSVKKPFEENYRVKKGIRRALLLLFIGYILRYPSWTIVDFSEVTAKAWQTFFIVDVLQLIGFSLLLVLLILFVTEKLKLNYTVTFIASAALIFLASPFMENINWNSYLPAPIAAYFYSGSGSLFPIFPWAGYVVSGAVLGSFLAQNPMVFKSSRFSILLAIFGATFILTSMLSEIVLQKSQIVFSNPQTSPITIFFRMGFVLLLTTVVSYISLRVERIPQLIILVGRNTLLIYVVHLIILYGSIWTPGLNLLWGESFSGWQSFIAALIMIILMTYMVIVIHKLKIRNKELVT
ncbi:MAG TPA: heparan-alpha-glucosaminide N-acetyltransferase domain-containing protein [Ignavibacteriaceae bacterium]|nr:heparan-alpha-glucosaminide N-acetyltransferase domain-containing protein [Ignavibacteriaceae bacterium]